MDGPTNAALHIDHFLTTRDPLSVRAKLNRAGPHRRHTSTENRCSIRFRLAHVDARPSAKAQNRPHRNAVARRRWFLDGFPSFIPGGVLTQMVDMTRAQDVITRLKAAGVAATYTHLLVRAAALALSRCPDAHKLVCGYKRMTPGQVDIGLSVAGQTNHAPVLVIADAASRPCATWSII